MRGQIQSLILECNITGITDDLLITGSWTRLGPSNSVTSHRSSKTQQSALPLKRSGEVKLIIDLFKRRVSKVFIVFVDQDK